MAGAVRITTSPQITPSAWLTVLCVGVVRKRGGFAFEGTAPEQRAILGEMEIEGLDTTVSLLDAGGGYASLSYVICSAGMRG